MKIGYDAKRIFHNTTGLGNYSRDLVRIMSAYYPDNEYILFNPKPAKIQRLEIKDNMQVVEPKAYFDRKLPFVWRSKTILKDLIKNNVDIYHGLSGELPFGIEKTPLKSVVTIHDLIFLHFPHLYKPIDRKIYNAKFKKACISADKIVAISQQTKKDIIKNYHIPDHKIEVIYQGCHQVFKTLYLDKTKKDILQKYHLPEKFILNVGTIEERKNAFTIVKAIKDTDIPLVIVGRKTLYANQIEKYVKANNMAGQVFFLEGLSLKELAVLYQSAKMFVYPSIYEGFGIPIIEALYSKIPVITNSKGVFSEAAGPHSFYLDNVLDVEEMKEKIKYLWQNDVKEQVEKSHRFVQKFNDNEIAAQWMNLYRTI